MIARLAAILIPALAPAAHEGDASANRLFLETLAAGKGFSVNGATISQTEMDRALVYIAGRQLIDRKIIMFLCEEELQARMAAGVDPASFKVLGEEVEKKIAETKAQFATEHPDVDFGKNLAAAGFSEDGLREHVATSLVFERLFLPDNPKDWPEITKEIINAKGGGTMMESLLKEPGEGGKPAEIPAILKSSFAQWLLQDLMKAARILYASDGLSPDLVFTLNGRPFRTKEAMERLGKEIRPAQLAQNRLWLALSTAMQQDLTAAKSWLTAEETQKRWDEMSAPYANSFIPLEAVVLTIKNFPSMEIYRNYFRLLESYRKKITTEINDETLKKHAAFAQDFLGGGSVETHTLLVSAWDFATNSPLSAEAREKARLKAEELKKKLDEGADFEKLLDEHSGYPEKNPNPQAPVKQQWRKGRFQALSKNELKGMLGESEFESFLKGHSIADAIFEPGKQGIIGPFQGPYGSYLVKIVKRTPGAKTMDLANTNQRQLVTDDYLTTRLFAYANEIFGKAKVEAK